MRYEDELKGKGKQVKGTAKEKFGKLAGDRDLQERGNAVIKSASKERYKKK
jgi:uncharacterized protein YjbJ (UPF0337 family)